MTDKMTGMKDKIQSQVIDSTAKDPVTTLPLELFELILPYINYRQVVQMLRVSKSWNRVLHSVPPLLDELKFPGGQEIKPLELSAALKRFTLPRHVEIPKMEPDCVDILKKDLQFWDSFKSLQSLKLSAYIAPDWQSPFPKTNLQRIGLASKVPVSWICESLLPACPKLAYASFMHVTGQILDLIFISSTLTHLELQFADLDWRVPVLPSNNHLFSRLPRLEALRCWDLEFGDWTLPMDLRSTKLEFLDLAGCDSPELYLPPTVRVLRLGSCSTKCCSPHYPALENLERLFVGNGFPRLLTAAAEKTKNGKLRRVDIADDNLVPYDDDDDDDDDDDNNDFLAVPRIIQSGWFDNVRTLWLKCTYDLSTDHCRRFVSALPNLESLTIYGAAQGMDAFITGLIEEPKSKIVEIHLHGCAVVDASIYESAEKNGVSMLKKTYREIEEEFDEDDWEGAWEHV